MPNQYFTHRTAEGRAVRCRVFIRNHTDGWNSQGLTAIFIPEPEEDLELRDAWRRLSIEARRAYYPESIRSTDAADLVRALVEAKVPKSAVIFESPETDHSDGALLRNQFVSVQESMSHYPTGSD